MRNKFLKSIFFVFILMICSAIAIFVKEYSKTATTFKSVVGNVGVISMRENSGYNELKSSIDQKYTKEFVKILNETSNSLKSDIEGVLGENYVALKVEYDGICDFISNEVKKFNNSKDYLDLKEKLAVLKEKIDALDKSSKQEYLEEFRGVLSEISTLNTKFNNTLKDKRDRLEEIKCEVKELFVKNKDALIDLRRKNMDKTRELLKELLVSYSVELKELNEAFNVNDKAPDYPFDVKTMDDCLVAGKLETECYNEILNENSNKTVICSENNVKIPS